MFERNMESCISYLLGERDRMQGGDSGGW
eukprot:COSAG05_NODE_5596_length_1133_cov_25.148539_1_plen_28_part_10